LCLYMFLSCLLGFAAYQALAAALYKRLLEMVIRILQGIYRFFKRLIEILIIAPIKWLLMVILSIALWIIRLVFTVLIWILNVLFYPVKVLIAIIYKRLPKKVYSFLYKYAGFYSTMKNTCIRWLEYITFKRR